MEVAKAGDRVQVRCFLPQVPGKNRRGKLLEFTVGSDEVIPGISLGVVGMAEGEQKHLTLRPQDAYGVVRQNLIKKFPRQKFPQHLQLHAGKRLSTIDTRGRTRRVTIVRVSEDSVVVDANHRLAGEALEVDIRLVSLVQTHAHQPKPHQDVGGEG